MKTTALALLLALPAYCDVKPGTAAPAIHLQAFVPSQSVDAVSASLKGKAIVLEFWATWCAPCVAAIPHLNELVASSPASRFSSFPSPKRIRKR